MSYLSVGGSTLADLTQATISLWFRIPKASIDKAAEEFERAWNSGAPGAEHAYGVGWQAGSSGGFSQWNTAPPQMAGIIPLLTFGQVGSESNVTTVLNNFGTWVVSYYFWQYTTFPDGEWIKYDENTNTILDGVFVAPSATWSTEPSYIGVWCTANPPRALLAANFETGKRAVITGLGQQLVGHEVRDRQFYSGPTDEMPERYWGQTFTVVDLNPNPLFPQTECFRVHPRVGDVGQYDGTIPESPPFGVTVTPDHWHHLLLSFDFTAPCTTHGSLYSSADEHNAIQAVPNPSGYVDSAPKIWIAFDDENKQGRDLSYYWIGKGATGGGREPPLPDKPDAPGADPNAILSPNGWRVADSGVGDQNQTVPPSPDTANEGYVGVYNGQSAPHYECSSLSVQVAGEPMGLPASADWVDNVHHVEMAELQIFAGLQIDTEDEKKRRCFINEDGKPVDPSKKATDTDPQSGSIEELGTKPDILLRGSTNWINGKNTGSLGLDSDGKPIRSGQFTPTAKIKKYTPAPSLHGRQTDGASAPLSRQRR